MKMIKQHQPLIKDEFAECCYYASLILGIECNSTLFQGDSLKGDNETMYQITPKEHPNSKEKMIEIESFNSYFYKYYGKWDERCYFDTPYQAFFSLLKAWHIWNNEFSLEEKEEFYKIYREL